MGGIRYDCRADDEIRLDMQGIRNRVETVGSHVRVGDGEKGMLTT